MGLQGTIETFPLEDVMALLASSNKSGRLTVTSDKLGGVIWFDDGKLFRADLGGEDDVALTDAFVALLRLGSGSFRFDQGQAAEKNTSSVAVETVLAEVTDQLSEYEELERTIPNMQVAVRLVQELSAEEVVLTTQEWRVVTMLHGVLRAADLATAMTLSELDTMRLLSSLDSKGLISVLVNEPEVTRALEARPREVGEESTATFMDLAAVVDRLDTPETSLIVDAEPNTDPAEERFFDHDPTIEIDQADIAA
ncbi:MAG: DUF4388 domain-containing protein, partial [Acidobacteria bacterium]|nr:DUF4388 domain-containing protein [Acidobacteriota bacterium]